MERIYILRGRGPSPCFNTISWISSQNRQFTSFVLIVCLKGVMPHQRSICKFISIYGILLEWAIVFGHVFMFVTYMHEHTIWLEMLWCWEYSGFVFGFSTNAALLYSRQITVQYRNTAFCMRNLSLPGMLSHNQNISGMDVVVWCCYYVYILNCSIIVYLHYSNMYNSRGVDFIK